MYPKSKTNNNQYPIMPSLKLSFSNSLKNLEFVYLKLDFAYLIFLQYFVLSRFFIDNWD